MMINRSNYEEYLVDYFDGSLSDEQKQQLFSFLDENPDLNAEFDRFSNVSLPKEKVFFDKDSLKKNTITRYNYKTYFIAYFENDLDAEEKIEVEKFLEVNPSLQKELELLRNTKLQPDYSIRFENKNELKRGGKVIAINAWVYRSAALAACIALAFFLFYYNSNKNETQVATITVPPQERKTTVKSEVKENIQQVSEPVKSESQKVTHRPHQAVAPKAIQQEYAIEVKQQQAVQQLPVAQEQPFTAENKEAVSKQEAPAMVTNETPKEESAKPYTVFSDEELAELGLKENPEKESSLLNKAAGSLGKKLFGKDARLQNTTDEATSTQTFALAIGQFEFSRTIAR
jgi:hypothetical protein